MAPTSGRAASRRPAAGARPRHTPDPHRNGSATGAVTASVVVPTLNGAWRLERLLESLVVDRSAYEVIVVVNGSRDGTVELLRRRFPSVRTIVFEANRGFARAINAAARETQSDALVLVNDDCVCAPGFVETIVSTLAPSKGVVMAAGVLLEARDPAVIDSAGMTLDRTLLPFDYLNGLPVAVLDGPVEDPIGPSGACAAFDRDVFLDAGGFDERLFAYWEDVDLVLRLRLLGGRCTLARGARAVHEHSATLGSGSRRKDYLTGFGRGYMLRKWSCLSGRRVGPIVARDAPLVLGQALLDRNLSGLRGRLDGFRAARPVEPQPYPELVLASHKSDGVATTLARRLRRRVRLRGAVAA